ncbi:ATP-dependent DNA helicase [Methyloversatilis discipulorum]|uniref:ATP-dependent DNA helicase n=1 Tax=Methyloversatilis discipulorum TaxID=1119528 RepID=UPI003137A242
MTVEQTLRVTAIRSQNPRGFGGCIFSAKPIDDQGRVEDARSYFVVKATGSALGGARVEPGQWWKVAGEPSRRLLDVNGYQVAETQIEASSAVLLRPSGEHIVSFMADSQAFEGIGQVKARKLWETFGERLYEHLDCGNVAELSKVLTPASATQVVGAWAEHGDSRTLQWLQAQGFDLQIGRKVMQFFGPETAEKLEEDPYRLLSFCANWRKTDSLARSHFGVAEDDPRRLQAAVEEACYRTFSAGHTSVLSAKLMVTLEGILGAQTKTFKWRSLVPTALSQGLSNGSFVIGHHGVQPLGAMVMERVVAQAVAARLASQVPALLPKDDIDELLLSYEKAEGIELNEAQWEAVHLAAARPFALITGGAGVGKTTVLKGLYEIYDRAGMAVTQLALAGRAAKRMQEATGRPASTIANFLRNRKDEDLDDRCVVVVDEASMVDIITMSRLCELIGPAPRLVLVGDPAQLMPVGPGLVLHALAKVPQVPVAQLTVVKRYSGAIALAAAAIREGTWPELSSDPDAAIAFIPCARRSSLPNEATIPETVLRLYRQDPANTQILCARRNGPDGAKGLNALCQSALTADAKPVQVWDERHDAYARVGFHLGDPVLCTRNLWDRGLQNGSLGVVVQVDDEPQMLTDDDGEESGLALAWVDWDDGVRRPIVEEILDDLELGYAITVHKAQGSQWPRVIVPLTGHRLLDRTLVYTAVTRAQRQVLLIGDAAAAKKAVEGLPRAHARQVSLDLILSQLLRGE